MADIDLKSALEMFQGGAKQLMLSRAVGQANDQVNQIRASEASEQDKRSQLTGISQNLVAHMAQMGTPETTMQLVAGQFGPKQYANANAMNLDSQLTGNAALGAEANQQQTFENNKAFELAKIKAAGRAAAANDPLKQEKFDFAKQQFATKQFNEFGKDLDNTAASSKTGYGLMGVTGQRGDRLSALLGDPNNFKNLNGQDAILVAEGLANMVKGGVATESEIKGLLPGMANQKISDIKTYLTSNPAALNSPGLFQKFQGMMQKEASENSVQTADTILKRATNRMKIADLDPDQFKATVAKSLSGAGMSVKPDDVIIDKKNGVTIPQIQQLNDKADAAEGYLKKASMALKSSDPAAQQEALQVYQKFGVDPKTPIAQAVDSIHRRVRRGQL